MTSFAQVPDFKTLSSQRLCCSLPMSMSKGRRKSFLMNDVSEVSRDWFNVFFYWFNVWKLIETFQGEEEEDSKDEDDDENPRRRAVRRWKSWHFNLVSNQFGIFPRNRGNWLGCMSSDNMDLKINIQECSTVPAPHCDPWQSARLPQVGDFFLRGETDETKWRQV